MAQEHGYFKLLYGAQACTLNKKIKVKRKRKLKPWKLGYTEESRKLYEQKTEY